MSQFTSVYLSEKDQIARTPRGRVQQARDLLEPEFSANKSFSDPSPARWTKHCGWDALDLSQQWGEQTHWMITVENLFERRSNKRICVCAFCSWPVDFTLDIFTKVSSMFVDLWFLATAWSFSATKPIYKLRYDSWYSDEKKRKNRCLTPVLRWRKWWGSGFLKAHLDDTVPDGGHIIMGSLSQPLQQLVEA